MVKGFSRQRLSPETRAAGSRFPGDVQNRLLPLVQALIRNFPARIFRGYSFALPQSFHL